MRYLLITLMFFSVDVIAETLGNIYDYPVVCGETKGIFQSLTKLGEKPYFLGNAPQTKKSNSFVLLWRKEQDKTWTITFTAEEVTCIIATGEGIKDYPIGEKT